MKKILLPSVIILALSMASCSGVMEMKKIDMTQIEQINDSMQAQIIPGSRSVHVLQDDDYSKATIIIRNTTLYTNKGNIPQAATRMGMMLLHVLGKDNNLSKATLVVTQVDDDQNRIPADGISADMKIDSLKNVLYPGK